MIRVDRHDDVVTIALDRPAARNAITPQGWDDLAAAFAAAADARALLLRAATPGVFSAGADLAALARLADHAEERAPFHVAMRRAIDGLAALQCPTLALVEGGCFGAAVALACAADIVVASLAARFAVPPALLGIAYPPVDVARIAARVGQGAAARLLFTGETIDAAEAHRLGLVDVLTDDPDTTVAAVCAADPVAQRALKTMLRDPADPAHKTAFENGFNSQRFRAATDRYRSD